MTPKHEEIIARARELWHNERARQGDPSFAIEPEVSELKEGGYLSAAKSELMRGSGYEYEIYLKEAKDKARCKTYLDHDISKGKLPLDFNECRKSNILISGTNQVGKSLCAMGIAELLRSQGWQVLIFDNVGIWKEKSGVSKCYVVKKKKDRIAMKVGESTIFDISLLKPKNQRKFVEQILEQVWQFRVLQRPSQWLMIVFEEFQLYARNVRGEDGQNVLRIMSVGANHKIRCLGITPDLSLIDCAFIRLAQQRYHFRLGNEPNAKRRFRSYYGKDWCRVAQELDVGFTIYINKNKLAVWKIPLFQRETLKCEHASHSSQRLMKRNKPK